MKKVEELGISPAPWSACTPAKREVAVACLKDDEFRSVQAVALCRAEGRNADARLIAAAPELYEFAIAALAEECDGCKFAMWDDNGNVRCRKSNKDKCPAQKLRDAIAKAGGME